MLIEFNTTLEERDRLKMGHNLRRVFFDYLRYQKEGMPVDFDDILDDIERIFEILEQLGRKA